MEVDKLGSEKNEIEAEERRVLSGDREDADSKVDPSRGWPRSRDTVGVFRTSPNGRVVDC